MQLFFATKAKGRTQEKAQARDLQYRITYVLARIAAAIMLVFPLSANLITARFVGWAYYHLVRRHRELAAKHLRDSFGDTLSDEDIKRISIRSFQQQGMWFVEALYTPRLVNAWTWPRYIRLVGLAKPMRLLLERRGCIMLTGHYGSWELLGYTLSALGFDITAVMRPLDNPYLWRWLLKYREARGLKLVDKRGAMEHAEDIIGDGGALCFIADQDAGRKGMFVDFFGRPASAYKSIGLLALQTNVPIVVGYARRTSDAFRYDIGVNRIIYPEEWADKKDPLRWLTQEWCAAMEAFIREAPEQYLWIHRRWKSQPNQRKKNKAAESSPPEPQTPEAPAAVDPVVSQT